MTRPHVSEDWSLFWRRCFSRAIERFQELVQVRGVAEKDRKALMGGGYTWILVKLVIEGESIVAVSYKENDGGEVVKKGFKVNVTAPAVK